VFVDREFKLSGYELFRFGTTKLKALGVACSLPRTFFAGLFRRFSVTRLSPEDGLSALSWPTNSLRHIPVRMLPVEYGLDCRAAAGFLRTIR
jgi:hypothetical protein